MSKRFVLILAATVCLRGYSDDSFHPRVLRPPIPVYETRWAKDVSAANVHPEYPRPQMVRSDWLNLNGSWDLSVTRLDHTNVVIYEGKILVPFPVESILSGVKKTFTPQEQMQYERTFKIPAGWQGKRMMLHFEAVDWETTVWVNGQKMGTHRGGYDSFSFDITDALKPEGDQTLTVSVTDPSDTGNQPAGKQMLFSRPPFLSASSGIWQTVWLEPVPATHINSLKLVPDTDNGVLRLTAFSAGSDSNECTVEAVAFDGQKEVSHAEGRIGEVFDLPVPHAKLWSPDHPFLYDLKITMRQNGRPLDSVTSYFGMRKISIAKDANGYPRLMLNNRQLFELGALVQGYWPDGIYAAPSDDALRYDVEAMKELGFNLCRMHVKVESERWYYWCDKLGLLVWQDMPNGDRLASPKETEIQRTPASAQEFEKELKRMIVGRGNHPSIVMWIAFNQGWGQYDTVRITDMIKKLDPSRLVIDADGWYDKGVGDVRSLHEYPGPATPVNDGRRACVDGECGGLGMAVPGHLWRFLGIGDITYYYNAAGLTSGYTALMSKMERFARNDGLSGGIITQLVDVETEADGFMTYDRAVMKMPPEKIKAINQGVIEAGSVGQ